MKVKLLKKLRKEAREMYCIAVNGNHLEIYDSKLDITYSPRMFWIENLDEVMGVIQTLRRQYMKLRIDEMKIIREIEKKV